MIDSTENRKKLTRNTLLLYVRTFCTLLISLYTSRVVLNVLGITDYGIYNVVGGFVAMFALISGSLTASTQRFLTFELGKKEKQRSQDIFSSSLLIHFALAAIVFVLMETVGLWFLNYKMNIAADRLYAANWVFQCSIFTFIFNLISIPYNASVIAHEKMAVFAYISILEAVLKLTIAISLSYFFFDKLIVYVILMLLVALCIRLIYGRYCNKKFVECKFKWNWDKELYKYMISFAGWNFIGTSSAVLNGQGINVLMNLFFGIALNAAKGIASQIESALNQFVASFTIALNPQITKSFAQGDIVYTNKLVIQGARYSFYLVIFLVIPIFVEAEFILKIWLKIVPEYTVMFVRLSLIYIVCQTLSQTLYTAMLATGKIKKYQVVVGGLSVTAFPLTYFAYKLGASPEWSYFIIIIISISCLFVRVFMLKGMTGLNARLFIREVILKAPLILVLAFIVPSLMHAMLGGGLFRPFITIILSFITTFLTVYFVGLGKDEKLYLIMIIKNKLKK